MPNLQVPATTGDPSFRAQNSAINSIRTFTRVASESSQKLSTQERILSPGDDIMSFSASRQARTSVAALRTVQEIGQINVTGLELANKGLDSIKGQLDGLKRMILSAQNADSTDQASIQAEIDIALAQIDATAKNTKLGNRSLLNGSSMIQAFSAIATNGTESDFTLRRTGTSLTAAAAINIQDVKVNKLGSGIASKTLTKGDTVLSLRTSITTNAIKATAALTAGTTAGAVASFRVTGKLGSVVINMVSTSTVVLNNAAGQLGQALSVNALAEQTGLVLTGNVGAGTIATISTVGFGDDEFIKIEHISGTNTAAAVGAVTGTSPNGTAATVFGKAAIAKVNGTLVTLGGEFGTVARYQAFGNDIEIKFSTALLSNTAVTAAMQGSININVEQGLTGLLSSSGNSADIVQYGIGKFTTDTLGRGNAIEALTTNSGSAITVAGVGQSSIASNSVSDLGSSGSLALSANKLTTALKTIDRAVTQVIAEQTRLGTLQADFVDSVARAETAIGDISAADADLIGVDAASEISNLVHAQLGISSSTSLLSQANQIQANLFALLR